LKLLLVLALIALLIWLLYRRLRPYLQVLRQVLSAIKGNINPGGASAGAFGQGAGHADSRLVRCAACDTWIPFSRALNAGSNSYCSKACLKQAPAVKKRKTAS
jgi:hypothetical protein